MGVFAVERTCSGNGVARSGALKRIISIALFTLALVATAASAHTSLKSSSPAAGAYLDEAPENLVLSFGRQVNLFKVTVETESGEAVNLGDYRSGKPAADFTLPLPALTPGSYTTTWIVLGEDGHKMSGSFQFTVADGDR
jgi:hypothetical protein